MLAVAERFFHRIFGEMGVKSEEDHRQVFRRSLSLHNRSLGADLISSKSPASTSATKHIVIVMDGLKEFTMEPLEWVIENLIEPGCIITLLSVMPWLNIPLSSKTWLDVSTFELGELNGMKEKIEWKSDVKYQKLQGIIDLCQQHRVVPYMSVAMGHPLRLVVVERIKNLQATWVVFDSNCNRYHRRNREYYAGKIPCNIVMMNGNGEVDMIRGRSLISDGESTPGASPYLIAPKIKLLIARNLKNFLGVRDQEDQ